MYQVRKRDSSLEEYDRNKIIASIMHAGGTREEADKVASEIDTWLPNVSVNSVIDSADIRTKILGLLGIINPVACNDYAGYVKQV